MADHASPRTTKLYDRTGDEVTLDEVERIAILRDQVDSEDSCQITEAALNDSAANVAQLTAPA